jgi:2-dehydro-3-deoxygalactonokinase
MGERMRWADGYIAVDWGTTNRRGYRMDANHQCTDEFEDSKGVLSVGAGEFPTAVKEIRERLGNLPILMAGMVGSNRGWAEAPYVHCPGGLEQLAAAAIWPEDRAAIVPGMAFLGDGRADVMRGEEVQVLGAVASEMIPPDCTVCHPGTHNKWVRVRGGAIQSFQTVMTGELFNLLKQHSILSDLLSGDVACGPAFEAGVRRGLGSDDLQAELFAVRARVLLRQSDPADAAHYTSGLLIGSDVRIGLSSAGGEPVIVMARPELTQLYAAAIRLAGREPTELDGERGFLAGLSRIAEMI